MTMPYEQAIDDRKTLMPVLSQQRLAASQQHTRLRVVRPTGAGQRPCRGRGP